ncbi:hypothetical protein BpHYR1_042607 [Brachionus plicatilis]|uniref:Uncharacterized protein n=1 Tax=Brachionus plicatilis TaxID=10195 RepID=A0A3M7PZ44_BRAPC|nr:hypothetical protein BpHYR1_042607 [Brachionus plicatilis]
MLQHSATYFVYIGIKTSWTVFTRLKINSTFLKTPFEFSEKKRNKAVLAFLICFSPLKKVTGVFFSGRGTDDMRNRNLCQTIWFRSLDSLVLVIFYPVNTISTRIVVGDAIFDFLTI